MSSKRSSLAASVQLAFAAAALVTGLSEVRAQRATPKAETELPDLAQFVPADVGLYVQIDNLREIGRRHRNRDVWWQLLQFAGGGESNWRDILATSLGIESDTAMFRLFQYRVAIAAEDWEHLGDGVMMLVQPDTRMRRLLVRPGRARRADAVGQVEVYRTQSGLWIGVHHETIILSQHRGRDALFDQCVRLLAGEEGDALAQQTAFAERASALPQRRDGIVFWRAEPVVEDEGLTRWRPRLSDGAVALHLLDDRVELELLGTLTDTNGEQDATTAAVDRVLSLPQATLAAWATSIDPHEFVNMLQTATPLPPVQNIWGAVGEHAGTIGFEENVLAKLGTKCVFFVCADFGSPDLAPEFGFAMETTDSVAVTLGMTDLARHVVETLAAEDTDGAEPAVSLEEQEYLDTVIHTVHWNARRAGERSDTLAALVADNLAPAFAPVKDWMVFATSEGLVRDVVDASNGLSPDLGVVSGIAREAERLRSATKVAVVQPSFAQGTLRYWETILQERRRAYTGRTRLGVSIHAEAAQGQVIVADVDSNGPSAGRLLPGDGIIACNNELLPMENANDELKTLLSAAPPDQPVRLRVRRGEEIAEVSIERHAEAASLKEPTSLGVLLDKLAPLEVLASQVAAATYCVEPAVDGLFHARLSLALEEPKQTAPEPPAPRPASK